MTRFLSALLALSLGVNVLLFVRVLRSRDESGSPPSGASPSATGEAVSAGAGSDPTERPPEDGREPPSDEVRWRIGELEAELKSLRERKAARQAEAEAQADLTPARLRDRLRGIAALAPAEQGKAVGRLIDEMFVDPESWGWVPQMILEESDPVVLAVLAAHAGGLGIPARALLADEALQERLLEAMSRGEPADRRVAAAQLVRMQQPGSPRHAAWLDAVVAGIRDDADPRVAEMVVRGFRMDNPQRLPIPPEVAEALRSRAPRMPAGEGRAWVLWALTQATLVNDGPAEVIARWRDGAAAERDDLLWGLARVADDCEPARLAPLRAACRALATEQWPTFLEMYESSSVLETRIQLGAEFGIAAGLIEPAGPAAAARLREVAGRERDPALRERLLRLALRVEEGLSLESDEAQKMWCLDR